MSDDFIDSRSGSVEDFADLSVKIEKVCQNIQAVASSPNEFEREMRPFRFGDVADFTGISNNEWNQWIKDNRNDLGIPDDVTRDFRLNNAQYRRLLKDFNLLNRRPKGAKTMRLLTQQFKGGSSKSTTSLHLSQYLCLRGHRVLCIDTDPQGTLTRLLGLSPQFVNDENTIGAIFSSMLDGNEDDVLELKPVKTHMEGLDILPANLNMSGADIDIAASILRRKNGQPAFYIPLTRALERIEGEYDIVIIDSPPSFSFMAICLAWYANGLIIPVPAEVPDFAATGDFCKLFSTYMKMTEDMEQTKKRWNPIMFTHGKVSGSVTSEFVIKKSTQVFDNYHIGNTIKQTQPIANALSYFKSVFEITSNELDIRGIRAARTMYMDMGYAIEKAIFKAWEEDMKEANSGE